MILSQLKADLTDDFDDGYYQSNAVVTIRTWQGITEIWSLMKKGISITLWCDSLEEHSTASTKAEKGQSTQEITEMKRFHQRSVSNQIKVKRLKT